MAAPSWIVVIHYRSADQNHKYCMGITKVGAYDEGEACLAARGRGGDGVPMFAVPLEQAKAEAGDIGHYDSFAPWVAPHLAERGLPVPPYYRQFLNGAAPVTVAKPVGPRKPPPEVPPPIWDTRPINAAAAMDVTRVLCGGSAREH